MKNTIVVLLVLLGCINLNAQETIARFKYEDAEKAFVAESYQECIDNLDEAEKLLGKTAPNILHLKILAQHKLFEKSPYESYEALETLRKNCNTYLANYDIAGLEEKYRDVYDISGQLPSITSSEEFEQLGLQYHKELKEASLKKVIEQNNLVFVEGGSYMMGKNSDAHEVTLNDFYIGKYEVTEKEYGLFKGNNAKKDVPVQPVSWDKAMEYCKRLEKKYGGTWRLPTEAEWEYAARGGNKSKGYKFSGSDDFDEVAWAFLHIRGLNTVQPVGQKKPNELGIYDMSGNASELCFDWYDKDYFTVSPKENPMGPNEGKDRVMRGYYDRTSAGRSSVYERKAIKKRAASYGGEDYDLGFFYVGFRVVYIPD